MGQRPRALDPTASPRAYFGAQLRSWRVRRGLSQAALGRLTHVSGGLVAKVEKAERRPLPDLVARLDAVLETGGELARTAAVVAAWPYRDGSGPGLAATRAGGPRSGGGLLDEVMARRTLGAVAAGALSVCAAATAESARRPVRGVGAGWLGEQVTVGHGLAGLYQGADPRLVLPPAMAYADALLEVFGRDGSGARHGESLELLNLVVGVHAQVGLWSVHADRPGQAHRYLACAREIAESGPDRVLRARALGALSYLYSSAPRGGCGGNPQRALELLDEALTLAEHADGFTRGWLATWRADQHAALGNQTRARADLDLGRQGLDGDDGQAQGFFARESYGYGMRAHLDSVQALTHALGGQADTAEDGFTQVQAEAANDRRRAATHAHRALAHVRGPRPDADAAAEAVRQAVATSAAAGYTMGLRRAAGVRAGFAPGWEHLACVRHVDELVDELTGS
jgi:hypothetical protein